MAGPWSGESEDGSRKRTLTLQQTLGKVRQAGAGRMGKTLSKEEQATLTVLQIILSKRAIKNDPEVLKSLLRWGQEREFFATPKSVFDTPKWERLGLALWDAVSEGSKETKGLSTAWILIITVLK